MFKLLKQILVYQHKMSLPYSSGPFIKNPLIYYLFELGIYDSYGSGNEDYGILLKPFKCIPTGSVIEISIIDVSHFKISYIVDLFPTKKMMSQFSNTDFDWNFWQGYETKSIYLHMDINEYELSK